MPTVVDNFAHKRLTEQLEDGMRVRIDFDRHGLGDMIMFQPLYQRLKTLYPNIEFHLKGNRDQQYFEEAPEAAVDVVFKISFPETPELFRSSKYTMTKPEACAVLELGIPWEPALEFSWKPTKFNPELQIKDNCIGMVFQCNSDPSKGINPGLAARLWEAVRKSGFTPIEVQFTNPNHNKKNGRCAFANYSCRDFEPTVENLVSVIRQCKGFVGVNTGTFCAAVCIKNGHVLHLHTRHDFTRFYKRNNPVSSIDCTNPDKVDYSVIDRYLASCRS